MAQSRVFSWKKCNGGTIYRRAGRMKGSSVGRWGPGNNRCWKRSPPLGLAGWWWRDRVNRRQGALGRGGGCGHPWDGLVPSISCWCLPLAENSGSPRDRGASVRLPCRCPQPHGRGGQKTKGRGTQVRSISQWPTRLVLTPPTPLSGPPTHLILTLPAHFLARPLVSSWPRPLIFWPAHCLILAPPALVWPRPPRDCWLPL